MDKYKDFRELKDTSKQSLRNLFVNRCYRKRIDSPYADDIILYENIEDAFDVLPETYVRGKKGRTKVLTPEEIAELKAHKANVALKLPEDTEEKFAEYELHSLNPLEVEDYYIRKRVEAYLNLCRKKIIENMESKSKKIVVTRARAFCILHLIKNGKLPKDIGKNELIKLTEKIFPDQSGKTVYETIKINGLTLDDKKHYPEDYEEGLRLFNAIESI